MTLTTFLNLFVLPAVVFSVTYFPLVTSLTRSLLTPYPKADIRRRLFAATIDGLLVATTCLLYWNSSFVPYVVSGLAYIVFRDGIKGQSLGKLFVGLAVIDLETGRPATLARSFRRNALFLLSGASFVSIFLEARTVITDRQGQRLGDRFARTQVVEGLGARDLVKAFQDWLLGLGAQVDRARRRAEIDRQRPAA